MEWLSLFSVLIALYFVFSVTGSLRRMANAAEQSAAAAERTAVAAEGLEDATPQPPETRFH